MTDKILKEAFDKMVAIEEAGNDKPRNREDNVDIDAEGWKAYGKHKNKTRRKKKKKPVEENDTGRYDDDFNYDEDEMRGIDHYSREPKTKYKTDNIYADPKDEPIEEGRMEDEEGIDVFEDVQRKLLEVIEELDSAIRAYAPKQHSYWQAYGLAHLKTIAGSDEYLSSDRNINTLIDDLREELRGEPDDYDDIDDPAGEDSMGESAETDRMRQDLDTIRQRNNAPSEEPRSRGSRLKRRGRGTGAADRSMRQR